MKITKSLFLIVALLHIAYALPIGRVKKALVSVEAEVVEILVDEEKLAKIKLKAEATMIQLKCLKESISYHFWDA